MNETISIILGGGVHYEHYPRNDGEKMSKEDYKRIYAEKREAIKVIEGEIRELKEKYCEEYSPFKVGDTIRLDGKSGVISSAKLCYGIGDDFEYMWRPFKKDGSPGCERKIWSFDIKKIEKV